MDLELIVLGSLPFALAVRKAISTTPGRGGHEMQLADAEQAATILGIRVRPHRVTSLGELQRAFAQIANDGAQILATARHLSR